MHILSKSTYIKGLQCEKALYMTKKHPYLRDKLSITQRAIFKRGTDVGILAQQRYPGGVNMSPSSPTLFPKKVEETMENLNNPDINVMYEAVFQYNDTLVMVDILVRDGDQWKAIEVKSSLKPSPTYYNDAALQYYVLHGSGVMLSDFQLMHLNGNFVKEGPIDVEKLFVNVSVLDYAKEKEAEIASNVEHLKEVVAQPHAPLVNIGVHCHLPYTCDFLGHCWKMVPNNSFLYTTALPDEQLFECYFGGFGTNQRLLERLDPEDEEAKQIEALENNTYYIDYKTLFALAPNPKPRHVAYLNLLCDYPAVPELDGKRPYQEMPLAFVVSGDQEPEGYSVWHCFDDHSRSQEALQLIHEKLTQYDLVVSFAPMNHSFQPKLINLYGTLIDAHFYHPKIKNGINLQNIAKALFHEDNLFEHSRILVEASETESTSYEQAINDLITENEMIKRIYQHFFH